MLRVHAFGQRRASQTEPIRVSVVSYVLSLPVSFVEWRFGNYARVA